VEVVLKYRSRRRVVYCWRWRRDGWLTVYDALLENEKPVCFG
jgi:hypothetical protein